MSKKRDPFKPTRNQLPTNVYPKNIISTQNHQNQKRPLVSKDMLQSHASRKPRHPLPQFKDVQADSYDTEPDLWGPGFYGVYDPMLQKSSLASHESKVMKENQNKPDNFDESSNLPSNNTKTIQELLTENAKLLKDLDLYKQLDSDNTTKLYEAYNRIEQLEGTLELFQKENFTLKETLNSTKQELQNVQVHLNELQKTNSGHSFETIKKNFAKLSDGNSNSALNQQQSTNDSQRNPNETYKDLHENLSSTTSDSHHHKAPKNRARRNTFNLKTIFQDSAFFSKSNDDQTSVDGGSTSKRASTISTSSPHKKGNNQLNISTATVASQNNEHSSQPSNDDNINNHDDGSSPDNNSNDYYEDNSRSWVVRMRRRLTFS